MQDGAGFMLPPLTLRGSALGPNSKMGAPGSGSDIDAKLAAMAELLAQQQHATNYTDIQAGWQAGLQSDSGAQLMLHSSLFSPFIGIKG